MHPGFDVILSKNPCASPLTCGVSDATRKPSDASRSALINGRSARAQAAPEMHKKATALMITTTKERLMVFQAFQLAFVAMKWDNCAASPIPKAIILIVDRYAQVNI